MTVFKGEIQPPSIQSLTTALGLTTAVWICHYASALPGLKQLDLQWTQGLAAFFVLLLWLGPARPYLFSLFAWSNPLNEMPRRLIAAASLLIFVESIWQTIQGAPQTHFHAIAFLLTFDLMGRSLLRWDWQQASARPSEEHQLTRAMLERLEQAQTDHPPLVKKTGAGLPVFYGTIGGLAGIALVFWRLATGDIGAVLLQAATVLVIASPWAFLVAVPNSFRIGLRLAATRNILISAATVLEQATHLNAIIFGKRGTMTQGLPRVTDIIPMTDIDEEELLLWAASAEHDSQHPFGQAIVAEAESRSIPLEPPERFTELTGRGVECVIDGQSFRLGRATFFKEKLPSYLADRMAQLAQEGKTSFLCSRGGQFLGMIAVTEELRHEAAEVIEHIRHLGLQTILLTGDDQMMSESLAEQLHIDRVVAEVLPDQKTQKINKLRREGLQVGMIGHFSEDRECLDESDLGITLTRGKGIELPSTDIIFIENNLKLIITLSRIARRTLRTTRENRALTLLYHIGALLVAGGLLIPFGFAPLSPITAALCSAGWLTLVSLNNRRLNIS